MSYKSIKRQKLFFDLNPASKNAKSSDNTKCSEYTHTHLTEDYQTTNAMLENKDGVTLHWKMTKKMKQFVAMPNVLDREQDVLKINSLLFGNKSI